MAPGSHREGFIMENAVQSSHRISSQRGVSLIELLIVVAIVGMISVVTVPAFASYYKTARVKSSMRQFTSDVRTARQRAVTRARPVKMTFALGARTYALFDSTPDTVPPWTQFGSDKRLEETMTLNSATFVDEDTTADGLVDIIFQPNGTIHTDHYPTEVEGGKPVTKVAIRTSLDIPNNEYKIYFERTGRLNAQRSSY